MPPNYRIRICIVVVEIIERASESEKEEMCVGVWRLELIHKLNWMWHFPISISMRQTTLSLPARVLRIHLSYVVVPVKEETLSTERRIDGFIKNAFIQLPCSFHDYDLLPWERFRKKFITNIGFRPIALHPPTTANLVQLFICHESLIDLIHGFLSRRRQRRRLLIDRTLSINKKVRARNDIYDVSDTSTAITCTSTSFANDNDDD